MYVILLNYIRFKKIVFIKIREKGLQKVQSNHKKVSQKIKKNQSQEYFSKLSTKTPSYFYMVIRSTKIKFNLFLTIFLHIFNYIYRKCTENYYIFFFKIVNKNSNTMTFLMYHSYPYH